LIVAATWASSTQKQHTAAAQKVLDDPDADLAHSAKKLGKALSWTATEPEVLRVIMVTIFRRVDVVRAYEACDRGDAKNLPLADDDGSAALVVPELWQWLWQRRIEEFEPHRGQPGDQSRH
jgi:hypothetical protein